jgi:predicted nucleotidyltransferase
MNKYVIKHKYSQLGSWGLVAKMAGLIEPIRTMLEPYSDQIRTAFVYGSMAEGTGTAPSDIDLMVIGDELEYSRLYAARQDAGTLLRRKGSPTFLSREGRLAPQGLAEWFLYQQGEWLAEDLHFWFGKRPPDMSKAGPWSVATINNWRISPCAGRGAAFSR